MQEEAIRHFATTLAYRMNLDAARSADPSVRDAERRRFQKALAPVLAHQGPKVIVTDSQVGHYARVLHSWGDCEWALLLLLLVNRGAEV